MSQGQLDRVSAYLDAYAHDDERALRKYFDDSIVWHVAGAHPLSGDYEGSQAVIDYLAKAKQLSDGTLTLEPIEVLATGEHVALFVKVRGQREGRELDVELVETFKVGPDGRWSEFWSMANDQEQVDEFWSLGSGSIGQ